MAQEGKALETYPSSMEGLKQIASCEKLFMHCDILDQSQAMWGMFLSQRTVEGGKCYS